MCKIEFLIHWKIYQEWSVDTLTYKEYEKIIQNALIQYKHSYSKYEIENALNMMENVFIMCNSRNIKGISQLQISINDAKNKLDNRGLMQ